MKQPFGKSNKSFKEGVKMSSVMVLLLTLFLNWLPLAAVFCLFFNYPNGLFFSLVVIAIAGLFAISPIKESIGRVTLGCRPATTTERNKILGSWNSVIKAIGESLDEKTKERFEKVDLFVSDEKLPNAFALGSNTVCVTKGLLNLASPGAIAGVLAHEAGHLYFGDSQRLAIAITTNQIGIASYNVLSIGMRILEGISKAIADTGAAFARSGGILLMITGLACWIGAGLLKIAFWIFYLLCKTSMEVSILAVGRNEEFRADLFAKNIGFGQHLVKFLKQIEALDTAPQNIWQVLYRTHPPTAERIDRLEVIN
jgi:heat shock protein HtpX